MTLKDENRTYLSRWYAIGRSTVGQFKAELHKIDGQAAYFAITGEERQTSPNGSPLPGDRALVSCGQLHGQLFAMVGQLRDLDELLPKLTRWQHCRITEGPMHYIENGCYWWMRHLAEIGKLPRLRENEYDLNDHIYFKKESYDPDPVEAYQHTVIHGALKDDTLPPEDFDLPKPPDKAAVHYDDNYIETRKAWAQTCRDIIKDTIRRHLEPRLPRLMALFEEDMVEFWGPDVRTDVAVAS